jgi:F-type H+-transporting ATPase subunit gamma
MPTLLDFRRRIRSVKNTQQITRAMKFVAAARLRRAQERAFASRPYARQMSRVLRSTMARIENPTHPLMAHRPEQRVLLLVLTGDRGLCGAFNANVIRKAFEFLHERKAQKKLEVLPIGKKGRDALRKQKWESAAEYINVTQRVEFSRAKEIADKVIELYTAGEIDAVYVVFNEFKTVLTQKLTLEKLLPIEPEAVAAAPGTWPAEESAHSAAGAGEPALSTPATPVDYIYEQPPEEIFARLLPRYAETQVFRAMLESSAAEHAARMTAMESATNNASELIDGLTLHMNKVRQAAITKEIIEVVSGAASTA